MEEDKSKFLDEGDLGGMSVMLKFGLISESSEVAKWAIRCLNSFFMTEGGQQFAQSFFG